MEEAEFDKVGRDELAHLEESLDEVDPDEVEYTRSDGVLTLELKDGVRVVVNTHRAARQIWMAAVDTAWHFDYVPADQRWRTPDGVELRETLSRVIRDRIQVDVKF
jgi:CyaY protein